MKIKDGYTRVSDILAQFNSYASINPQVLQRKASIGSEVHEAINATLNDIYLPISSESEGYYRSWEKWKSITNPTYSLSEERFYDDDLMITGCVDGVIQFPHSSSLNIIDYKTSSSENAVTWPLQAGFYHYLAKKNGIELTDTVVFIKLDKKGLAPKVFEYCFTESLFYRCMNALETFRKNKKHFS